MEIGITAVRQFIINNFKFYGLWRVSDSSLIYKFYGYALHVFFTLTYTITMFVRLLQLTDLEEFTSASGMAFTLIALSVKVLNFFYYLPNVQKILQNCEEFQLRGQSEVELLARRIKFFPLIAYLYYTMANIAGFTMYVNGLWTWQMPFPAWFPFIDIEEYFMYIYVYQVLGMVMMVAVNICMELLPCYLMYLLSIQTEVICKRMETLAADLNTTNPYRMMVHSATVRQRESIKSLADCIRMHQQLYRYFTPQLGFTNPVLSIILSFQRHCYGRRLFYVCIFQPDLL